jgi:hypothetical protein
MKCSNADCNRGIGLVHHQSGWFSKRRYCSRNCRDAFVADLPRSRKKPSATTYFEWLFLQPECLLLAQSGHPDALNQYPLSGVKQTSG